MDRRARKFLMVLANGGWHRKFPQRAVTSYVVGACLLLGLAESKLTRPDSARLFSAAFRITPNGVASLREGQFPDTPTLDQAISDLIRSWSR